jgi:hypothetical protein
MVTNETVELDDGLIAHYTLEIFQDGTAEVYVTKITLGGMIVKKTADLVEEAEKLAYAEAFIDGI